MVAFVLPHNLLDTKLINSKEFQFAVRSTLEQQNRPVNKAYLMGYLCSNWI